MSFRKVLCALVFLFIAVFEFETVLAAEDVGTNNTSLQEDTVMQTSPMTEQIQAVTDPKMQMILFTQQMLLNQGVSLEKYTVVNVLGDSITEGVGASDKSNSYPSVLAQLLGAKVNNYGVSGSRITDTFSAEHPGAFVNRMYGMDRSADLIVVFGGTNDYWYGDCPIGKKTDTGTGSFYGALNKMMSYLKNAYPESEIVFITPYQQSKDASETQAYKRSTNCDMGHGTLSKYRNALLDRCQYYNIPVLDLYADYELNTIDNIEALRKYGQFLCDGCHLNDSGYNLLARKIYTFVMQDFTQYVPQYVNVNGFVFETAALPAMVQEGCFVLPDGQVFYAGEGVVLDSQMDLKVLYNYLIEAMY